MCAKNGTAGPHLLCRVCGALAAAKVEGQAVPWHLQHDQLTAEVAGERGCCCIWQGPTGSLAPCKEGDSQGVGLSRWLRGR